MIREPWAQDCVLRKLTGLLWSALFSIINQYSAGWSCLFSDCEFMSYLVSSWGKIKLQFVLREDAICAIFRRLYTCVCVCLCACVASLCTHDTADCIRWGIFVTYMGTPCFSFYMCICDHAPPTLSNIHTHTHTHTRSRQEPRSNSSSAYPAVPSSSCLSDHYHAL